MKFVDLFCGAGGFSAGLVNAGFNPVAAFDAWDAALAVYRDNLGHHASRADLSRVDAIVDAIRPLRPDLIAGGPPCQDFSGAGPRVEGARADLTASYAKIVSRVRPEWFVMENVARAATSDAFAEARIILSDAGYGLSVDVLDASRCGVPQRRKRLFCIGRLGERDGFLQDTIRRSLATEPLTVRQFFGDELDFEFYYRHPRSYDRRAVFSVDEPAPTMRGTHREVARGYKQHARDPVPPHVVRALTTLERSRIQTFPAWWRWKGKRQDVEQMIGNAVPVNLAAFVAGAIAAYLAGSAHVPMRMAA